MLNEDLPPTNSSIRFNIVVQDTESDPTISLEKLKLLTENGIRIVIGPATSANVEAIKDYADKNDIIIMSHSSTAPSLAVAGDNLFRFVPNNSKLAEGYCNGNVESRHKDGSPPLEG